MSELDNIIEDLGFQHSDRDGYMSGLQWKQFAIDLLSASPSIKQGPVAEQFEAWWDSPDAPNGQQYEKDIAKQAWVASTLYRYTPTQTSPAQSDKESVRNAAYENGWISCANWAGRSDLIADTESYAYIRDRDISLKSQLSGNPGELPEPSDTEMLDWMIDNNGQIYPKDGLFMVLYGPDHHKEYGPLSDSRKNAIKAAMQAEREGK